MELLLEYHQLIISNFGPGFYILLVFLGIIGIIGQWMLYYKCDLPGIACIVPIWNVTTFLKIVDRPAWQSLIVMIPPLAILATWFLQEDMMIKLTVAAIFGAIWVVYMVIIYIEICKAFGKNKWSDYVICIALNGFYVLYLGLGETEYLGPQAVKGSKKKA